MHHPRDRITHTTAFVTPVVEHWLEQEIAQWVHQEGSIRRPHKQDSTYHGLCYTSRGALAGTRNSSMAPPQGIFNIVTCNDVGSSLDQPCVWSAHCIIELFLVLASAPRLVYQRPWYVLSCLWDGAYKRTLAVNRKE